MKPLTLLVSMDKYEDGVNMTRLIREYDDTADVLLHEAKRGNGWSVTAYICIPAQDSTKLISAIRESGALCALREAGEA